MRTARLKTKSKHAWYHFTARASGYWDEIIFDDDARANFVRILKEVADLTTVQVLDYAAMGNHVHIVARPGKVLSKKRVVARYNSYYEDRFNPSGELSANDAERAEEMAERLSDCSYFVKMVLHRFTNWFNTHGDRKRSGRIWSQRYKTTIVEAQTALWPLLQHIALNPLRVGDVEDPAEYAHSAYGEWMQTEVHPFESTLLKAMKQMYPKYKGDADRALDLLIDDLVDVLDGKTPEYIDVDGTAVPTLVSATDSRRFWTDAGIVGSEGFVRSCIAEQFGKAKAKKQKIGMGALSDGSLVSSMRRLRFRATHGDVRLDEDND